MTKVIVPKAMGQYGISQLNGGDQLVYEVVDHAVEVPDAELARFLYVVEGSRVDGADPVDSGRNTRAPERSAPVASPQAVVEAPSAPKPPRAPSAPKPKARKARKPAAKAPAAPKPPTTS